MLIFNKLDQYEANTFDEYLPADVKKDLMQQLERRWDNLTHGNAMFISALELSNIERLRETLLDKVKELYEIRYPYLNKTF